MNALSLVSPHGHGRTPAPTEASTWPLVRAAQSGDREAFATLYGQHAHQVYRYVLVRTRDHHLAEDITSDTFTRALGALPTLRYQGREVGAWLLTIARNIILDHRKSSKFRREVSTGDYTDVPAANHDPESAALQRDAYQRLRAAIGQLNPEQRRCILLRFYAGLTVAETAEAVRRTEGAVKALTHRATRMLGQLIDAAEPSESAVHETAVNHEVLSSHRPRPRGGEK